MRCFVLIFSSFVFACGARSGLELPQSAGADGGTRATGGNAQGATSGSAPVGGTTANPIGDAGNGSCVESMCTSGGWCWLNPLPQGNSLFDVLVHEGELWATGDDGLVLRGDGQHWLRCPTPTTESLRGSWFSPHGVFWAVGTGGVILSFDGGSWTQHHSEPGLFLNDVNGSSEDDIWVVGDDVVLHFNGRDWERQAIATKGSLYAVWVSASNDLWVAGTQVWHFDGTTWRVVHEPANPAKAIWSDNSGTVWLAAADVLRCDLLGCDSVHSPVGEQFDIWGTNSNDVWTVGSGGGMHWDGFSWSTFEVPTSLTAASGGAPYGLVAVGHFGRMFHRKGTEWTDLRHAIGSVWTDVWGLADDDVWISGNSMAHYDGRALTITVTPTDWGLQTVRGAKSNDLWAAGCNGTLIHWDGHLWSDSSIKPWPQSDLCFWSVWGDSARSAVATGSQGTVYRWNGLTWLDTAALPSAVTSRAVFGVDGYVLAVDDSGVVWEQSDPDWQAVLLSTNSQSNALWGASLDNLWVVGEYSKRGHATHYSNGVLSEEQVNTTALTGIWGTSAADVWLTGDGTEFHYDGKTLVEQPSGVHISNSKIWVSPSGTRWMTGGNGILRHLP